MYLVERSAEQSFSELLEESHFYEDFVRESVLVIGAGDKAHA